MLPPHQQAEGKKRAKKRLPRPNASSVCSPPGSARQPSSPLRVAAERLLKAEACCKVIAPAAAQLGGGGVQTG